jgi:predicted PurR-regulated permease PerM
MTDSPHSESFIIILGLGLLGLLVSTITGVITPFVVTLVMFVVLLPFRHNTVVRAILTAAALLLGLWLVSELLSVLTPVIIAFLLAYMLDPLVDMLHKRKVPRALSAAFILAAFIGVLALAVVLVVPVFIDSFKGIDPAAIVSGVENWINTSLVPWLLSMGVQQADLDAFVKTRLVPYIEGMSNAIITGLFSIGTGLAGILGQLANLLIIPITMLYILIDFDRIKAWIKNLFPEGRRDQVSRLYGRVDAILSAYLRGAITIAVINMIVVSVLFSIAGIPFGLVLGVLSGLFCLIPQFGILITLAITTIVTLFSPGAGLHIVIAVVILLGENTLESSVLYPKIVGSHLGLHPVALIASLFVFSYFLGFLGMLLAVPLTSLLARFVEDYLEWRGSGKSLPEA